MSTKMLRWLWPRHWARKEVLACWVFDGFWEVFVKKIIKESVFVFVSKA